jgi:hypothetical protein
LFQAHTVLVGVVAFLFGLGVGAAPDAETSPPVVSEPTATATVTATIPAAIPQDQLDALAAREGELDDREADLDARASELDHGRHLETREAALAEQEQAAEPAPPAEPADDCHPSYDPCAPIASDVDCDGGSGNGLGYTGRVRVIGPDGYGLDDHGDGIGCESS